MNLLFDEEKADFRQEMEWETVLHPLDEFNDVADAVAVDYDERDLRRDPPEDAVYAMTSARIDLKTFYSSYQKDLREHIYRNASTSLLANKELKLWARPGETEREFGRRCLAGSGNGHEEQYGQSAHWRRVSTRSVRELYAVVRAAYGPPALR